ncbi:MAG: ParA family protein [Magnetococcales bacterium]|nr:ParA family protein [Magnetococcales bacterium]
MNTPELLLNWVDVARKLLRESHRPVTENSESPIPKGVVFTRTFWDRLLVGVAPDTDLNDVWNWLSKLFGERWEKNRSHDDKSILLEAQGDSLPHLPVEVEELDANEVLEWRQVPFQPRFTPPRTAYFSKDESHPPKNFPPDQPPVLAFHSFKGGVGRTLCTLATTLAYTAHEKKVLLVDADFEAPGISFLYETRNPDLGFSMADLLTMLHADPKPSGDDAMASAKIGVLSQHLDNVFVLPCYRDLRDSVSLEIRPEHLIASTAHPPFFLGDILSRLGKELKVDVVIVDLRAGLSELSAPIIFDPRIKRILVTNASGQSIRGTQLVIQEIGKTLQINQWPTDNLPALILNQLPGTMLPNKDGSGGNQYFSDMLESINQTLEQAFSQPSAITDEDGQPITDEDGQPILAECAEEGISHTFLSYNEPLASLSGSWEDALKTIQQSLVPQKIWDKLQLWLPATSSPITYALPEASLDDRRILLRDFAGKFVYADGTFEATDKDISFLAIQPLTNLAKDHTAKLPMVVSIGAKGAGKTYAFLNIARSRQWQEYVTKVDPKIRCNFNAPVFPLLWSKNTDLEEMQQLCQACQQQLGLTPSSAPFDLPKEVSRFKGKDIFAWRDFWANAIAQSLGKTSTEQPFESLQDHINQRNQHIVILMDGLEETFPEFTTNRSQQLALRALLQEIPNWLRTLPGAPIGIIVFVRQDMVAHAIPQNRGQFVDRFKNYALRWTWDEALELVAWVCVNSRAIDNLWKDFNTLNDSERMERLRPLWGMKLGGDETNEAIANNWVLSVLSDLRGRIQGRDVVRFLSLAARESVNNTKTTDRLLAPTAMRQAIKPCSQEKVVEIGLENEPLKKIFSKIKEKSSGPSRLPTPCTYRELASRKLSRSDVELMEENGVIFFDEKKKEYHFPEIFRHGLGVEFAGYGRKKVLSLIRQVRNQGRF